MAKKRCVTVFKRLDQLEDKMLVVQTNQIWTNRLLFIILGLVVTAMVSPIFTKASLAFTENGLRFIRG